jgi:hypothetical protein
MVRRVRREGPTDFTGGKRLIVASSLERKGWANVEWRDEGDRQVARVTVIEADT